MSRDFDAAKSLHEQGNLSEAAAAYRRVPAGDPLRYKALNNLGLVLEAQDRLQEAVDILDQAIAAKQDSAILHCNRARVLHRLGRIAEAVVGYRRAIALDPDWVDPHHNLAMAQQLEGNMQEAEDSYRRTLELEPANFAAHSHLGDILFDSGRMSNALIHYRKAVAIDPGSATAQFDLAKALAAVGSYEPAAQAYRRSLEIEPRSGPAYQNLADVLRRMGRIAEAIEVLRKWLALAPNDPVPRHLVAALTGEAVPARADEETVRRVFDEFAASFDSTLALLGYRAPQLILGAIVARYPDDRRVYRLLDAGCGTGLCGPLLRSRAERLIGVDLSPRMLRKARERGVYDELVEGELTEFLQHHPACYDIIASADALNYFGVLDEVLGAAAGALRAGGHFVFTLECEADQGGQPWRLQTHGRYSHCEEYVRAAVKEAGLNLVSLHSGNLRTEGGEGVEGWIVATELA